MKWDKAVRALQYLSQTWIFRIFEAGFRSAPAPGVKWHLALFSYLFICLETSSIGRYLYTGNFAKPNITKENKKVLYE